MWVFIDTHETGKVRAGLIGPKACKVSTKNGRSSALLPMLSKYLNAKTAKYLSGICVVAGPGSFSSIRSGVLVANLFARILRKQLVGVTVSESENLETLIDRLMKGDIQSVSFVAPVYGTEPNITLGKVASS